MDVSCLQYGLTDEERSMFDEKGYFVVENALSPEHVARLTAKVDGIHEQRLKEGFEPDKGMFFFQISFQKMTLSLNWWTMRRFCRRSGTSWAGTFIYTMLI